MNGFDSTVFEQICTDNLYTVGKNNALECGGVAEDSRFDVGGATEHFDCVAAREYKGLESGAVFECVVTDCGYVITDYNTGKSSTAAECSSADFGKACGESDGFKSCATFKCAGTDLGNAFGNDNALEASATCKCISTDFGYGFRESDGGQVSHALEHAVGNTCNGTFNNNAFDAGAVREDNAIESNDCFGEGECLQARAAYKQICRNVGNLSVCGEYDAFKAGTVGERTCAEGIQA